MRARLVVVVVAAALEFTALEAGATIAAFTQIEREVYAAVLDGSGVTPSDVQQIVDPGLIVSPSAQSLDLQVRVGGASSAFSSIAGSVEFGLIRMTLTANVSAASVVVVANSLTGAQAFWIDEIKLTSNTLPVGTPVDVFVAGSFHRVIGGTSVNPNDSVRGGITVDGQTAFDFGYPTNCGGNDATPCQLGSSIAFGSGVLHRHVGDTLGVQGFLVGGTNSTIGSGSFPLVDGPGMVSSDIDASSTEVFALSILTPGASYSSASGTVYPTIITVPEASSGALTSAGVAGVLLFCGCSRLRRLGGRRDLQL